MNIDDGAGRDIDVSEEIEKRTGSELRIASL